LLVSKVLLPWLNNPTAAVCNSMNPGLDIHLPLVPLFVQCSF
jgi:hypothetical protein